MIRLSLLAGLLAVCIILPGCVNVRTPDVRINAGAPREPIDPNRIPPTQTHEEARAELVKAYDEIRHL